jgi:hypothetical protein
MKSVNATVIIIGLIGVLFGAYDVYEGGVSNNALFLIFIGIVLCGTAYFNNEELKKKG